MKPTTTREFILEAFGTRANYIKARDGILNNTMHRINAVALICSDPDFIAEYHVNYSPDKLVKIANLIVTEWRQGMFSFNSSNYFSDCYGK